MRRLSPPQGNRVPPASKSNNMGGARGDQHKKANISSVEKKQFWLKRRREKEKEKEERRKGRRKGIYTFH